MENENQNNDVNNEVNEDRTTAKGKVLKEIKSWVSTILFAVVFALIITKFIIVNAVIPSGSMEKTIMTGDRIIANRIEYYFTSPERFDIAVFKYPDNPEILYIKRVIGEPGDKVEIKDNEIYINDSTTPLENSFVNGEMVTKDALYVVPKKGDSLSDFSSFIYNKEIYDKNNDGLFDEDCYFMMGDNRNNSEDSRKWLNTFVPKSFMEGKAIFRYYPFNQIKIIKNNYNK